MSPDLHSTQVISTSWKKDVFLAHSRAAPRPRSSSALLLSITAPLLKIPALNFQASCTPSSATFRHCLFQRNRSCRANQYLLLWLLPEPHGPSAPSPETQGPGDNMLIWEKYSTVLLIDGNVFHPSDVRHRGKLLKKTLKKNFYILSGIAMLFGKCRKSTKMETSRKQETNQTSKTFFSVLG